MVLVGRQHHDGEQTIVSLQQSIVASIIRMHHRHLSSRFVLSLRDEERSSGFLFVRKIGETVMADVAYYFSRIRY